MADPASVDPEYRRYLAEIELYEREYKQWEDRGKKILRLYKDSGNVKGEKKRFNVLWSNVETLKPALYARDPQPVAERRFKDSDPIGRVASDVAQRCLSYTVDCQGFSHVARQCVTDRLLPGRGASWFRYEPTLDGDDLQYEQVDIDYVYWEDFGHQVARTWAEVGIVWRRVFMTRDKLVKRFGDEGKAIPLDHTPKGIKDDKVGEDVKKAAIYELWDKDKGVVTFLSKSHPKIIESKPPELKLTDFWPTQRPLYATLTTDSLVPVPDYALYQTQAQQLEDLTARIDAVQEDLKVAGVYDSSAAGLAQLLGGGYKNKLIPVDNWAKFSEKGGLDGSVDFLPLKEIAEALLAMYEAREKAKHDLYELTGIADIIRGNSEPEETATAQQIKGRFAVLRISDSQADVQRWVRDGMRIIAEIICENFDLETIKAISGVRLPTAAEKQAFMAEQQMAMQQAQATGQEPPQPDEETAELMDQPTWEEVHALLSNQVLREFRIDIETDSTIRTDEEAERAERTEFLTAAGTYMDKAAQVATMVPEAAPLMAELLMFGVRSFRSARALEPAFEDFMKQIEKPKPPQPDPDIEKEKIKAQAAERLAHIEGERDVQVETHKQQMQAQENQHAQQLEDQRADRDSQREAEMERYKADITKEVELFKARLKAETDIRVAEITGQQERERQQFEAQTQEREYQAKDAESQRKSATTLEQERMKGESAERDRQFQEKQARETEARSGERTAKRDNTLAAAQKLIEALAQLKGQKVH